MEDKSIMLVDIGQHKCQSLTFTTSSRLSKADLGSLRIRIVSKLPVSYYELYEIHSKRHLMRVRFVPRIGHEEIGVSVIYRVMEADEAGPPPALLSTRAKATDQFAKLCQRDVKFLFNCEAVFVNKRDEQGVLVPFPMKFPATTLAPYDEIRGMRFVKTGEGKILVENYMDLISDDTLSQRIRFAYEAKFTFDLPSTILQESKKLMA